MAQLERPHALKTERELRYELALCYRAAAQHKLNEGVCNHFTAALPGNERFLVIAHGHA